MSSSANSPSLTRPRATRAWMEGARLWLELEDGRQVGVPVEWFGWLASATEAERDDLQILEGGAGVWWPRLDDGISVPGLFGLPEYP